MCESENKIDCDIPVEFDISFKNEDICSESFQELKNLPEINKYIQRLKDCILRQHKLLHKLFHQLQEQVIIEIKMTSERYSACKILKSFKIL